MSGDSWKELAAAYVLGALDPDERAAFEAQTSADSELRQVVAEYEETLALVASKTSTVDPPPQLRDRILADAASVRPIATASKPEAQSKSSGPDSPDRKGSTPWLRVLPWGLAAAALAAAVSSGLANRASTEREADLMAALNEAQGELAARDSLLATFLGPNVRTASLAATGEAPSMHLFLNSETERLVIAAFNLPPAPAGRTYQLWGIETGQNPVSLGTFQTEVNGTAILAQSLAAGLRFDVSAVTEEPQGGSPQPTTTPFMVGSWSAAQ